MENNEKPNIAEKKTFSLTNRTKYARAKSKYVCECRFFFSYSGICFAFVAWWRSQTVSNAHFFPFCLSSFCYFRFSLWVLILSMAFETVGHIRKILSFLFSWRCMPMSPHTDWNVSSYLFCMVLFFSAPKKYTHTHFGLRYLVWYSISSAFFLLLNLPWDSAHQLSVTLAQLVHCKNRTNTDFHLNANPFRENSNCRC